MSINGRWVAIADRPKTRLEREFHPQVVRELKGQSTLDILAAHAIRTGLVDEDHLRVVPTMLGGGITRGTDGG